MNSKLDIIQGFRQQGLLNIVNAVTGLLLTFPVWLAVEMISYISQRQTYGLTGFFAIYLPILLILQIHEWRAVGKHDVKSYKEYMEKKKDGTL